MTIWRNGIQVQLGTILHIFKKSLMILNNIILFLNIELLQPELKADDEFYPGPLTLEALLGTASANR